MIVEIIFDFELLDGGWMKVGAGVPCVVFFFVVLPVDAVFACTGGTFACQDPFHFEFVTPFVATSMDKHVTFGEKAKSTIQVWADILTNL